ncbi:MAG TPA: asparaginase [Candidatus Limnocylindrales bacterium]|nr:asparaginase [Candidatus Limnocylindrales bacterium]
MARVAIVFTGGTISMRHDPVAGGNVPTLSGADILAQVPGLDELADVVPIDRGRTPASHFTFPALFDLWATIRDAASDPAVDGVVVVQGTDTIEETAFFYDILHSGDAPIVVTGAMRAASRPDYDGPANIRRAVAAAVAPSLRGAGVVVVLAGSIEPADDVTKTHASSFDTFQSLNFGPIGRVDGDQVIVERDRGPRRHVAATRAAERVHLVTATVAMDGSEIDALRAAGAAGADGFVVAATGAGNTSAALLAAAERAIADRLPVALTTRSPSGAASADYAFPGGGATWVRAGAMLTGHLGGPKARVALALGIGAGLDHGALAALLADPVAAPAAAASGTGD